jgi:hypothetical protein
MFLCIRVQRCPNKKFHTRFLIYFLSRREIQQSPQASCTSTSPEETRMSNVAIGLQAVSTEANFQREKVELANSQLFNEIQVLGDL